MKTGTRHLRRRACGRQTCECNPFGLHIRVHEDRHAASAASRLRSPDVRMQPVSSTYWDPMKTGTRHLRRLACNRQACECNPFRLHIRVHEDRHAASAASRLRSPDARMQPVSSTHWDPMKTGTRHLVAPAVARRASVDRIVAAQQTLVRRCNWNDERK